MTPFRRKRALLLLAVLLAGCGAERGEDSDDSDKDDAPPVPVEIGKPTRGDIYAMYSGTAAIEAFAEADVIAKVAGEVREILTEEGDDVSKDQILARLDGDRLRLELNETQARLNKLRRDYERNVDLSRKGLISTGDFEKIKYEMEALEASYNLASLELDYTRIRAPIDGVVSERYIKLGNTLSVNDPVFRVTGLDPLVAYLHIPEREFSNIKAGQAASIAVDALDGPPVVATVTRVSPIVDPQTGTFKTTIEIRDPGRRIKPGMFARIGIVYDNHENALQIPRSALVEEFGKFGVFVVENGIAVLRDVEAGYSNRGKIEILSGLDDSDEIVIVGQLGLKDEARVNIINAPDDAKLADGTAVETSEGANDAPTD